MTRLPPQPGEIIDRTRPVDFSWNGRRVSGFEGDTIASALTAAGVRVVSRSMKYRRPRGYMTNDYWDPNALVQVGDEPNVRSAHRLIEPGMAVEAQNVWPSLERDLRAVTGAASRFLTPGFYYKTFMRPRWLWPTYEKVLATFSPGGRIDPDTPHRYHDKRYTHPDVVVAGGGPAGMSAAIAAAEAGARVLLVEHFHRLGGHLLWGDDSDRTLARELVAGAADAGVEVLTDSTVTGRYEDNWIAIVQRSHPVAVERLVKARAKVLVVAPGLIERPYVFAGNDKPGVMLSGAVRRFVNLYGVRPGTAAVVFTANPEGDAAAADLDRAGADVTVLDARRGENIVRALGRGKSIKAVEAADGRRLECDLLVTATGWTAPTSLLNMSGDLPVYDEGATRFFPSIPIGNVLVAGGLAGDGAHEQLIEHARTTGRLAAARARSVAYSLQAATARAKAVSGSQPGWPTDTRRSLPRHPHPPLFRSATHGLVDFSEDVSSKDMLGAADEGYDSVELLKRYTTATMGPSQGKLETVNTVAVLAEALGRTIGEVGTTVWRPPYAPITMGALGGPMYEPVRVSSIQPWHEANGAVFMLAGQWIRPDHYGDPSGEVLNTRKNVGIMDVTPLGKFDLRGPDVPKLLNHLYINKWMKLSVGSVRYGIMCTEEGVIFDDGVTARLGDHHYMMTTTSSGAASVWEWAENWLQTEFPDWQVHITPVTSGFTSINVAGPESRTLVRRLTMDVDLDPAAFKYMQVRTGTVAGVPDCFMWRIGFTGELSFEIHVPAGYGLHVWKALLEAGEDLGIRPFGVEGQRIMRLEKGHFIVGQDTDGLTKLPALGMPHLLKLDKHDFVGKPELLWALADTSAPVLVGIQPTDPSIVPDEAGQIVRPGTDEIIGRITSSRMSPTLGRSICLGQVLPEASKAGSELTILMTDGRRITARVMAHHAHFDPGGERVRG